MSGTIQSLGSAYNSPVILYGKQSRSYPLPRDTTHFLVEEEYLVNRSNYAVQARDTANGTYATAYNVDQQIVREEEDGIWFRRTYATIPAYRLEVAGTFNTRLPSLPNITADTPLEVDSAGFTWPTLTINFTSSHGLSGGEYVSIVATILTANGLPWVFADIAEVASAPDADTITVTVHGGYAGTASSVTDVTVYPVSALQRGVRDANVPTFMAYDYALPGVTAGISTIYDFQPVPISPALDTTTGTRSHNLSTTTNPTSAQYISWMINRTLVPCESSVTPYLGNILQRATRYFVAQ